MEVFSLKSLTIEDTIQVGAQPAGIDIVDRHVIYVANTGGNNLSYVPLPQRRDDRKVRFQSGAGMNDRPRSIAVIFNRTFFSTFNPIANSGRLMLDETGGFSAAPRAEVPSMTAVGYLRRSADYTSFIVVNSGALQVYRAQGNAFSTAKNISATDVGVGFNGTRFRLYPADWCSMAT